MLIEPPELQQLFGLDSADYGAPYYVLAIRPKNRGWLKGGDGPTFGLGDIALGHDMVNDPEYEALHVPLTDWQKYIQPAGEEHTADLADDILTGRFRKKISRPESAEISSWHCPINSDPWS